MEWQCQSVTFTSDCICEDSQAIVEELRLCDSVECVWELTGNPMFCDSMQYAPKHHYTDKSSTDRVINEMWADWWWDIQVCGLFEYGHLELMVTSLLVTGLVLSPFWCDCCACHFSIR